MKAGYRLLDHTADCYLSIWAGNLEDLLAQAALALQDQILDFCPRTGTVCLKIILKAPSPEILLFEWLREILFQVSVRHWVFSRFEFQFDPDETKGYNVSVRCLGERTGAERHAICKEVKAVTRHGLTLSFCDRRWKAKILLDV